MLRKNVANTILVVLLAVTLSFSICLMPAFAAAPAPFEVEVSGSTGYALCGLNLRSGPSTSYRVLKTMPAGTAFVILGESGEFLHVRLPDATEGYASSTYIMVNLPDVIPSICYNATNSYDSKYRSLGEPLPGITGQALYTGKTMNNRLGYEEYMMPVLYKMAKKIYLAQQAAMANGDCLILYEGYRPKAVQAAVGTALDKLAWQDSAVYNAVIANPNFSKAYFINSGVGNHQLGVAIDVSLGFYTETTPVVIGEKTIQKPSNVAEYAMPSPMHEL